MNLSSKIKTETKMVVVLLSLATAWGCRSIDRVCRAGVCCCHLRRDPVSKSSRFLQYKAERKGRPYQISQRFDYFLFIVGDLARGDEGQKYN